MKWHNLRQLVYECKYGLKILYVLSLYRLIYDYDDFTFPSPSIISTAMILWEYK